jgi:hypothetical protein
VLGQKDTEDGPLCVITPEDSGWYCLYVNNYLLDEADSFMAKKFRNRFRLPYPSYKDLLHQIISDTRFERWCGHKCNGKKSSPTELLLLGSLRYLGRGWTFNNIEEQTVILVDVHCNFFHKFIEFGSTTLYSLHVLTPVNLAEAQIGGPVDEFPAIFFFFPFSALVSDSAKTSKKAMDREQTEAPFPPIVIFTPRARPPT